MFNGIGLDLVRKGFDAVGATKIQKELPLSLADQPHNKPLNQQP
jgi:hypothetical protein